MRWTRIRPAEARVMAWKNGGGTTREYAVAPEGAALETGFAWRLSSAAVGVSGPFSRFPGLRRTLVLLDGEGFDLDAGAQGGASLARPLDRWDFAGDWPVTASLRGGASVDWNLMWDPRRVSARTEVLDLAGRAELPGADEVLVFVAEGTLAVPALELHLGRRHLLRAVGAGPLEGVAGYGGARLLAVWIDPAAG